MSNDLQFQLIVPILRSGAFTGMHIASQLRVNYILPAQYKYHYFPTETIEKKIEFPKLTYNRPENINNQEPCCKIAGKVDFKGYKMSNSEIFQCRSI